MRKLFLYMMVFTLINACSSKQKADLIVYNAIVYTVDPDFKKAEAFAVKDGKFLKIGSKDEITGMYESENMLDVQQRTIFPGFYDAHCHFFGMGQQVGQADLRETRSFGEMIERLKIYRRKNPSLPWIIGRGWDQNIWEKKEFPDKAQLDELFPDVPVLLIRVDGHAALVNQAALKLAKIDEKTKIEGGEIEKRNGKLTGIVLDAAKDMVEKVVPAPDAQETEKTLLAAQKICFANGLTTITDAGTHKAMIETIDKMQKNNQLKVRIYAMLSPTQENKDHYLKKGIYKTDRLHVRSFKFYADGALGSRGAYLLQPYSDQPGTSGLLTIKPEQLKQDLKDIYAVEGFQANTHCIGDAANRMVLDMYGELLKGTNNRRWRIEHAQVVDPADMKKFKDFSVIPSVQPTHATSDMFWAAQRLGEKRIRSAYAYKTLCEQNDMIAFGTDFPVELPNPIYTFHASIARQNADHAPEGGFNMENAVDARTALKAMTIWAAYANFEEKERGSIEEGKFADFIILDTDIMDTDPRLLRLTKVLNTFVAGEKVYSNYEAGY